MNEKYLFIVASSISQLFGQITEGFLEEKLSLLRKNGTGMLQRDLLDVATRKANLIICLIN